MRGPPPTPLHLRLLRGNPSRRPLPREPQPAVSEAVPAPPEFLSAYAWDEWWRVAPELHRLRLLSILDETTFAVLCSTYAKWRLAEEMLAKMAERDPVTAGLLVKTAEGNAAMNPLVGVARRAAADFIRYAGEFAMSPAARARIAAGGFKPPPPSGKFRGLIA